MAVCTRLLARGRGLEGLSARLLCRATSLGIAERTHDKMFDAIWKTAELAIIDPATHQLKDPLPSLADVAKYYEGAGETEAG